MKWITRERVKVDRVACPWLIKKFVDNDAEFFFVFSARSCPNRNASAPRLTTSKRSNWVTTSRNARSRPS